MKRFWLVAALPVVLLTGCKSDPYGPWYGPAVVVTTVWDDAHRALSKHIYAKPGTQLDDFEKIIQNAEHIGGNVNFEFSPITNRVSKISYEGTNAYYYGRFIKEETTPEENSPTFWPDEIRDPRGLAAKLKTNADPVSSWLFGQFSEAGRAAIVNDTAAPQAMSDILARELTAVVNGPRIYDENRFRVVSLQPQTIRLLEFHPRFQLPPDALAAYQAALNWALLEDAYPQELSGKLSISWKHHFVAVR